jgi:molybdopterin-guanine dinucleotide biosynthesis protein A
MELDAIVLAGGAGRRLGGVDKALIEIGGVTLIERAVGAVSGARHIIVAGPRRPLDAPVSWVLEEPPGAGPAHALAAALELVSAPLVVVLASDLPFVSGTVVNELAAAVGDSDGALVRDGEGRGQPLLAVYRTASLRARTRALDTRASSVHSVVSGLDLVYVDDPRAALDCDTPQDVEQARLRT